MCSIMGCRLVSLICRAVACRNVRQKVSGFDVTILYDRYFGVSFGGSMT